MNGMSAVMRAVGEPMTLEKVQVGEIAPDEVVVRIRGVGICHTDLSALDGEVPLPLPSVLGHEGAGVIEEIGMEVSELAVGDHVVLSFDHCRECDQCHRGMPAYCELFAPMNYFGTRLDGSTTMHQDGDGVHGSWFGQSSFGTLAVASARNAVKVDPDLPLDLLGPLGCGLQTGAGAVLNVLEPKAGESIAIFGLGTVGLAALMAAKVAGCSPIIAVDVNPQRLELARQLGATHTINPGETNDVVWGIMDVAGPGVHYAIEAVGAGVVVRQALESLRTPGTCITLGLAGLENEIVIDQGHLLIGRTLRGVIEGDADPHEFIPRLIALWRDGRFPFERLITHFPLDEVDKAVAGLRDGSVVKPLLVVS